MSLKSHSKRPPVVGFTLDYEQPGGYSKMPWYALRENYFAAISRHGGIPIGLPHEVELVEYYLEMIDALVVTGGAFDVNPALYGEQNIHQTVTLKERRTAFEWAITKGALAQKKPILGICGGEQLLNVVLGGTLIQHIPDTIQSALEHEQKNPRTEPGHDVTVTPGTLLAAITGKTVLPVNSAHHQAVAQPAPGVIINAVAPDGVIEGFEYPEHPFCLGVQWHPEYQISEGDDAIFAAFVKAAQ